jgi:hypothetical protein
MQLVAQPEGPTTLMPNLAVSHDPVAVLSMCDLQNFSPKDPRKYYYSSTLFFIREVGVSQEVSPLNI